MSVNRVFILGNLGADPELRYTQSQMPVCSLRMATNERRKNDSGEWVDQTEWHRVVAFGKQAENASQYLSKGRQAFVEGRIRTQKWQDKDGNDRYTTEIVANNIQFVGGRGGDAPQLEKTFTPQQQASASIPQAAEAVPFDDDDIPF